MPDYKVQYVDPNSTAKNITTVEPTTGEKQVYAPALTNNRSAILREAEHLVNGDRNIDYGDPIDDFRRTADMWSAYLGQQLKPHDVAALMTMLKLSRIKWSPGKRDHWADAAGYVACGFDCVQREDQ